jgi:SAM-dependent methyltransferase
MSLADWYDTPHYYDIIFDQDTEKEAAFLEGVMHRHYRGKAKRPWRVLEPACGSGRLVTALANRGHAMWGFDLNEQMLAYASDRIARDGLSATLWQDTMEGFTLPSRRTTFDLAHCLVSTFKYVLDGDGAASHLKKVAGCLRKGGVYVLGIHLTDYTDRTEQHERWAGERDGIRVTCNTHTWPADKKARTEDLRTRLRITRDGATSIQETRWKFRTYNARQVRQLLAAAPELELVACHDFHYDLEDERQLDDSYADIVLVLRRI